MLNRCEKYPFVISLKPNILGSSDNAAGRKLIESIIRMLQAGISTAMFLAPLGMTFGRMPFLYKYDKICFKIMTDYSGTRVFLRK